jgi:hypothetical protein
VEAFKQASYSTTTERSIFIGYPPRSEQDLSTAYVEVPVLELLKNSEAAHNLEYMVSNYFGCERFSCKTPPLLIAWGSLPSTDRLLEAFNVSEHKEKENSGPFWKLQKVFQAFADHYCGVDRVLPLV